MADAHGDSGDDTEGALGAHHHLAQVGTGGVGRRVAQHELALGSRDPEADHERVEPAVARGGLARGTRHREAADRGVLEGLREVAQGQAVLGKQRLGLRATQTRLEGGGHRVGVDREQPVEADQVEGDHAGEVAAPSDQAADDRGAAAEGDQRDAVGHAPLDQCGHLVVRARAYDGVGGVRAVAGTKPEQVGGGLAAGAVQPSLVVGEHVLRADDLLEPRQQLLGQRLAEPDLGRIDGGCLRGADEGIDQGERALRQRPGLGRVTPSRPVHLGRAGCAHVLHCDT